MTNDPYTLQHSISQDSFSQTSRPDWNELLTRLSEPFPAEVLSWRAGSVSRDKKRAQALPYAEPRAYEDRLNAVCPGDWSVVFKPWGEHKLICELTLYGVTRSSTGEYEENSRGAVAQGTAAEAQAFKRACSKFGLGRYLYDIPLSWVDYDEEKRRLLETPALPSRFLPTNRPAPAASRPDASGEPAPLLSGERAEAMGKELGKLGLASREQLKLASSLLKRPVSSFTQLSEGEALEVWASAKRQSRSVA